MIYIYRFLQLILSPVMALFIILRVLKGKEDKKRFKERLGVSNLVKDPSKKLVWVHCASVGESLSVIPLIKRLVRTKNTQVMLTTGTVTSAKLMEDKLPKNAFHQFVPIDYSFAVKRFIKHWRPDVSVFVESDLWPNLLHYAPNKILINARMSDRSFDRYKKLNNIAKMLLGKFDLILTQSNQDYNRFSHFANSAKIINSGNMKNDGPAPEYNKNEFNIIQQAFEGREVLVVSSTHKGEDEQAIDIYRALKKTYKDLLLVLVPRHPHRGNDIATLIKSEKLDYVQRSQTKGLESASTMDIYLADTLGEIGLWYALADVVVMGGSLVPWGGHNPLEPLKAGKPTFAGKYMHNFKDMTDTLVEKEILQVSEDKNTVIKDLEKTLADKKYMAEFSEKSINAISSMTGATEVIITQIRKKLKEGAK